MIVAVGSIKGAPGASTLATALGVVWAGERVVAELDLRGADLPFRLAGTDGRPMGAAPSIAGLAVDARPGGPAPDVARYAQQTMLGVPVIRGTVGPSGELPRHLPSLAAVLAAWPGVAFADLGELHPANPALAIARASVAVLVITRSTVEGLAHLRARIEDLTGSVGDPGRDRSPVGVVTVAGRGDGKRSVDRTAALLGSIGSPVPVLGAFNHDPTGAALLWSGPVTKRLGRSALLRSAGSLMPQIGRLWPELGYAVSPPAAPPVLPAGPAAAVL